MAFKIPYTVRIYAPDDSGTTKIHWYVDESEYQVAGGLFFEVVSPVLDTQNVSYLASKLWDTFISEYLSSESKDFERSLKEGISSLQKALQELELNEGIDANIVLFVFEEDKHLNSSSIEEEKRVMKLAVIGEADIILVREGKYTNLMDYIDSNKTLENLEYNEVDINYNDLLLISNRSVLVNAIESNLLDLSDLYSTFNSLEQLRLSLGSGKKIFALLFSELSLDTLEAKPKVKKETPLKRKGNKAISTLFTQTKNLMKNLVVHTQGGISKIKQLLIRPHTKINTPRGISPSRVVPESDKEELKLSETFSSTSPREEVVEIDVTSQPTQSTLSSLQDYQEHQHYQERQQEDPVEYLRKRRSFIYKLKTLATETLTKLKLGKLTESFRFIKRRAPKVPVNVPVKVGVGANRYVYLVIFLIVGIFALSWYRKYQAKKHDASVIAEFKEKYITPLNDLYTNNVQRLIADDPENYIDQCLKQADEVINAYESYKLSLKLKSNIKELDNLKATAEKIRSGCKEKYYEVYNITQVNLTPLKDFKVALGEESNVVDIDVYQGVIVALDRTKKAVYKINRENGQISVLSDPSGLIQDPVSVAIGTETIFVCDKNNGILYYDSKANQFKSIKSTVPETLGETCTKIDTFGKNVYFLTEAGNVLYKVVGLGNLRYTAPVKYITYEEGALLDLTIDGSIYFLVSKSTVSGYDVVRFYGGRYDPAFRLEEKDVARFKDPIAIFTNPAGQFPIYVYDRAKNTIFVIEKPTQEKHPGLGVVIKTYEILSPFDGADDIAVELSVVTNQEERVYVLSKGSLGYFKP